MLVKVSKQLHRCRDGGYRRRNSSNGVVKIYLVGLHFFWFPPKTGRVSSEGFSNRVYFCFSSLKQLFVTNRNACLVYFTDLPLNNNGIKEVPLYITIGTVWAFGFSAALSCGSTTSLTWRHNRIPRGRCMEWLFWREKDTLVTRVCKGVSCPISFRVNFTPSPQPFLIWSNFIPKFILFFPHGPHLNLSFIRPCHPFWPFSFILLIMSGKGQLYVIF